MLLNSQNKSNSEPNVTKNKLPWRSKSSPGQVEVLIQKYERLSNENIHSTQCYNSRKDKNEQCSEMDYPELNKKYVRTFLSVSDNSDSDKMLKKSTVKTKSKEKTTISKRKDDLFSRLFSFEEKNSTTLPNRKKESKTKNVARSVSASSKDKKSKYLSSNQDGGFVQSKISVFTSTGTIPKQKDIYRKRRESYVIATQKTPETPRKTIQEQPIQDTTKEQQTKEQKTEKETEETIKDTKEDQVPRRSYVGKTISKFENDCFTLPKKKLEQSINSLFQQYHDKKMGTSDKMTREELSLEIDNVLLNNFKQISRDSSPDDEKPNKTQPQIHSTAENTQQNIEIEEINHNIDNNFEENNIKTNIIVQSSNEDCSDIPKTNLYLEIDDNSENFKVSIENICENLEKVINENVCSGSKIKGIYVSIEDINMIENNKEIIENLSHLQNQEENTKFEQVLTVNDDMEFELQDLENKSSRKVLNLVSYFSGIISSSRSRFSSASTMKNETSDTDDNEESCIKTPDITISEYPQEFSFKDTKEETKNDDNVLDCNVNISKVEKEDLLQNLSICKTKSFNEKPKPKSANFVRSNSVKDDSKRYSFLNYIHTQNQLLKNNETETHIEEHNSISSNSSFTDLEYNIDKENQSTKEEQISVSRNTQNQLLKNNETEIHIQEHNSISSNSSFTDLEYNIDKENQPTNEEQQNSVSRNSSFTELEKRNSFLHRKNSDTESKPRFSRLYSGKFKRTSTHQDTNNNVELNKEEKAIFDKILNDTDFLSDSEGDYDHIETINPTYENQTPNYENSEPIDRYIKVDEQFLKENVYEEINYEEDPECVYENLKRFRSTDTVQVMYDEHERAIIRMSMVNLCEDFMSEEMKIQESEKEIMKNIEEIKALPTKKSCLINELITTERSYINNSLHRLVHDYMPEMDKEDIPKTLLGKSRQIFGNADLLYEGHKEYVLPALENYNTVEDIGLAFLNNETIFKYYPLYSKNKPKSDIVMKDHSYYFEEKQKELNDRLDLASFLLTPIQRLAKYCQLVGSLVKECEKEQIECKKLKAALEMLSRQMRMGNDLIALDAIEGFNGSILDLGELLLRDAFTVQPPNKKPAFEGMIFLFQRCLMITVICRQGFKETYLYKESFQLTDIGYSDYSPLEFSVWFRKRDVNMYKFITKSQLLKEKWTKEIFNLLWQQLEANKKRRKKELEENGIQDTRIPLDPKRPFSVPNKNTESSTKVRRKKTMNSSTETVWYTER